MCDNDGGAATRCTGDLAQRSAEARAQLVPVFPAGESAVVVAVCPVGEYRTVDGPGFGIVSPVEIADVQLTQFIQDDHLGAESGSHDIRAVSRPAQRGAEQGRRFGQMR